MKNSLIIQNIRRSLLRQLIFPALVFVISVICFRSLPLQNRFSPIPLRTDNRLEDFYNPNASHVTLRGGPLHYTGYDFIINGKVRGHYYYSLNGQNCQFYILASTAGSMPPLFLDQISLRGNLVQIPSEQYQALLSQMADDLLWKAQELEKISSAVAFSDVSHYSRLILLLSLFLALCMLLSLSDCVTSLVFICFPLLSPTFYQLRKFGDVKVLLPRVEIEMRQTPLACCHNLYLTPHYLVHIDTVRSIVLPTQQLCWVYCHQYKDRLFPWNRRIRASLHVLTRGKRHYECSKKEVEELDIIIDEIRRQFPEVLIGYNQQNRRLYKELTR